MRRLDDMSLDDLLRERDYWHRIVNDDTYSGLSRLAARDLRTACDAVIARRRAEDKPNGELGYPVKLTATCPLIETEPT